MNRENILRYLRIKGEPDEATSALIDRCMRLAEETAQPKRICNLFDLRFAADGVYIGDFFFSGEKIIHRLQSCTRCAVFAVTLGAAPDLLARRFAVSDPAAAVVLQAVLADYTEDFCDRTEEDIRRENPGFHLLTRFSPGYPGLPLADQKQIFAMMDVTKRIGITLTDSYLMIPSKSVTAIAGLQAASD